MDTHQIAESALAHMLRQGFDHAQVSARVSEQDELNIAHNEPSLMRTSETHNLALVGLLDGRRASTEVTDTGEESVRRAVETLFESARIAPRDEANAVSADQRTDIVQGPERGDVAVLSEKVRELLEYRASECPNVIIEEGLCAYVSTRCHTLTSGGSDLRTRLGHYEMMALGVAKEGAATSSFAHTSGASLDLRARHAAEFFGIGDMLKDTTRQIHTQSLDESFIGDVVFAPSAVADLLRWLLGQVTDTQLIASSSLYKQRVGETIASPLLSVRSRFDGPGTCAISTDAFVARPVDLIAQGRLVTLLPSLYGSHKTGLPHVPSAASGWTIDAGHTARADVIGAVARGALVGRLSMGRPVANGDFAGVIKNSFLIRDGQVGPALSEVMISGNIAHMLRDIVAVSSERIDRGKTALPWIRVSNLHFS